MSMLARASEATGITLKDDPRRKSMGVYGLRRVMCLEYMVTLLKRHGFTMAEANDFVSAIVEVTTP